MNEIRDSTCFEEIWSKEFIAYLRPKTKSRRRSAPIDGLLVGGVDAQALWDAYAAKDFECKTLKARVYDWKAFVRWYQGAGETLDPGTLDRYVGSLKDAGKPRNSVYVQVSHVRKVLRICIEAGLLQDGCAPCRRGGKRKGPSHKAVKTIPFTPPHRCLPFLGEIPVKKPRRAVKCSQTYFAALFRLKDADFTVEDLRKSYRILATRLHPDAVGEEQADHFRAVTEAYEWLKDPLRQAVFRLCVFMSHEKHQGILSFTRGIFDRLGGWDFVNRIWGN